MIYSDSVVKRSDSVLPGTPVSAIEFWSGFVVPIWKPNGDGSGIVVRQFSQEHPDDVRIFFGELLLLFGILQNVVEPDVALSEYLWIRDCVWIVQSVPQVFPQLYKDKIISTTL